MKTTWPKQAETKSEWFIVDAKDEVLGRLATRLANVLRGKHKTGFSPHATCGDFVVVVNSDKVKLTGNKLNDKVYYSHSGYIGGIKGLMAKEIKAKSSETLILNAVKGMLPRNRLGRQLLTRLKVYKGEQHFHKAQKPVGFPDYLAT